MRKTSILTLLAITALVMTFGIKEAGAAFSAELGSPNLSFRISDYQSAPPNVYVHSDRGRPYYVERDRRVYMKKKHHNKHYKKERKHHEDNGRHEGHGKHNGH